MELQEYQQAVKNFSDKKENFEFTNRGKDHAAAVVSNIFRTANKEILIYSGSLNRDVANDPNLVKRLNAYLTSGKKLRVILEEMPSDDKVSESLKQILSSEKNPTRDVKVLIDTSKQFSNAVKKLFNDGEAHHFMVADSISYRFEIDAKEYKAICNFNDIKIASQLKKVFTNFLKD